MSYQYAEYVSKFCNVKWYSVYQRALPCRESRKSIDTTVISEDSQSDGLELNTGTV